MKEYNYKRGEKTKRNHYIPQVYLRYFQNGKSIIKCYDKVKNKTFELNPNGIAFENHLYTAEDDKGIKSYEEFYTEKVDNKYNGIMERIKKSQTCYAIIKPLGNSNLKKDISNFITNQVLRLPTTIYMYKDDYNEFLDYLKQKVKDSVIDNNKLEEYEKYIEKYRSDYKYKNEMLNILTKSKNINIISNIIANNTWILLKNESDTLFCTSDSPIVTYNTMNNLLMKNGFGRDDVIIGFPLSKEYYIIIYTDNHIKEIDGKCFILNNESAGKIEFLNNLQIKLCERFIYYP